MMKNLIQFLAVVILATPAFSAEENNFSGESELSSVVVNGDSSSDTLSAKTKDTYKLTESDIMTGFGKYLRSEINGIESAKSWEAGLRYDRVLLKDELSVFVQQKAEHDPYNGIFIQRDSSDLGLKYQILRKDDLNWFAEVGYRYSKTYVAMELPTETAGFGRVYTEAEYKLSSTAKANLWIEHLPNLKNSDEYQTNAELSLSASLNSIFSLKTSYLWNRDAAKKSPLKDTTTTWTTALVANY